MTWEEISNQERQKEYFKYLQLFLDQEYQNKNIFPPKNKIFNAFDLTPFENIKVVILGQDPYHGKDQAQGLAFSTPEHIKNPPSMVNILKEIKNEFQKDSICINGDLTPWAKQGVLLLNTILTVQEKKAKSHHNVGWEIFTDNIIKYISDHCNNIVFLLWGSNAISKTKIINISKHFIENVSTNVLEQMDMKVPADLKDRFIEQNRVLRAKNIQTLKEIYTKNIDKSFVSDFNIRAFKRLRGSRTAAGFAERRTYIYDGEAIDKAWHLGIDWASVKHAPIKVSNSGKVVFEQYLGIYGNTIVIDHGMGLASLYAHTSTQDVNLGDEVRRNQKIANTGTTGAVMGDHLHFGILVQGIEVNPLEWMDKNWIKNNINRTIQNAKKEIDKK